MTWRQHHHISIKAESDLKKIYSQNVHLYIQPPSGNLPLQDLYRIASDRLHVLNVVNRIACKNYGLPPAKCRILLLEELKDLGLLDYVRLLQPFEQNTNELADVICRRNDHIAHFMLKLTFAFQNEKKRWFYTQEVRLLKWRLTCLDRDGILDINRKNPFCYTPMLRTDKEMVREYFAQYSSDLDEFFNVPHYRVPFTEALVLIKKRNVLIKGGVIFVPEPKLPILFLAQFKKNLRSSFERARELAAEMSSDDRFVHIFSILPNYVYMPTYQLQEYPDRSIKELDMLSERNYPVCMRIIHEALRTKHHVTNGARFQYGLFLKGIGVTLRDALEFWEKEFLQVMSTTAFQNKYRYNIRHLYGEEGKRANYSPLNCLKILMSSPGPRDVHGCPFKHLSSDSLKKMLIQHEIPSISIEEILELSCTGLYQSACQKYFNNKHPLSVQELITHPNLYFDESLQQSTDIFY